MTKKQQHQNTEARIDWQEAKAGQLRGDQLLVTLEIMRTLFHCVKYT